MAKITTSGNKITLQLDDLFKNSVSPETIAKEVQKAAAEYYAETALKEAKERERLECLDSAREDLIVSVIQWYSLVKDIDYEDEDYDVLFCRLMKNLKNTEPIVELRRPSCIGEDFFIADLLKQLQR